MKSTKLFVAGLLIVLGMATRSLGGGMISSLSQGQRIQLEAVADGYRIYGDDLAASFSSGERVKAVVVEVGADYIVVRDVDGVADRRIPEHSIKDVIYSPGKAPRKWTPAEIEAAKKAAAEQAKAEAAKEKAAAEQAKAEAAKKAAAEKSKWRTWTDASGEHKIEAKYGGVVAGKVKLIKQDGTTIMVPLEKLSDEDQKWIKNRQR